FLAGDIQGGGLQGYYTGAVPGETTSVFEEGFGKLLPAGETLIFQMHYTANGSVQEDTTKVGIVFGKREDVTHEVVTLIGIDQEFEIPPYAANHEVNGKVRWLPKGGLLLGVAPHMHVRGKTFELFADRDGETETLLHVPNYDFNWQHSYVFSEPLDLDTIDSLRFKVTFDNSAGNPFNPDPSQWVNWGDQTWEEMAVTFLEVAEPLEPATPTDTPVVASISLSPENTAAREAKIQKFVDDFFAQLDANGDGVVARGEVPIAVRGSLSRFDQDGDDLATRDEVRELAERKIP
ncbi:MAG: alkyl hydroperoxide reductase, partial [Fuerstia sp.]|nr:alkyl hydroperoxide reductase [Fuerstiella sp.]